VRLPAIASPETTKLINTDLVEKKDTKTESRIFLKNSEAKSTIDNTCATIDSIDHRLFTKLTRFISIYTY